KREIAVAAISFLPHCQDQRVFGSLVDALAGGDQRICSTAISALGELGDSRAFEVLAPIVSGGTDSHLRASAIYAIAKLHDRRTIDLLLEQLGSQKMPLSGWAETFAIVKVLGEAGDSRAIEPLRNLTGQASSYLKYYIEQALHNLGAPSLLSA
ncbi:MAG TPA: HEAT repeat domain-containing protein, partial [Ktedonobacteraceae bacterium]|nr:HEAT repeat domain-containing protein [Ktedonobacteraceae bacterium]